MNALRRTTRCCAADCPTVSSAGKILIEADSTATDDVLWPSLFHLVGVLAAAAEAHEQL